MCQMFEAVHTSYTMHGNGMWSQLWLERLVQNSMLRTVLVWDDSSNKWQILPLMHMLAIPAAWINIPSDLSLGTEPELGLYLVLPPLSLSLLLRVGLAPWGQALWVFIVALSNCTSDLAALSPGKHPGVMYGHEESGVSGWGKRQRMHWEGNFSQNSSARAIKILERFYYPSGKFCAFPQV